VGLPSGGLRHPLPGLDADPLNLVLVGTRREVAFPLVQRGWNLTEPFDVQSAWRSVKAFVLGSTYRTSPVSPLYLFGRRQDAALQKPRNDIDRRNHIRFWLTPFTLAGKPVWVGQVSRDIGVRFTNRSWYLTTHKIDPDVDEDPAYGVTISRHSGTSWLARERRQAMSRPSPGGTSLHHRSRSPAQIDLNWSCFSWATHIASWQAGGTSA